MNKGCIHTSTPPILPNLGQTVSCVILQNTQHFRRRFYIVNSSQYILGSTFVGDLTGSTSEPISGMSPWRLVRRGKAGCWWNHQWTWWQPHVHATHLDEAGITKHDIYPTTCIRRSTRCRVKRRESATFTNTSKDSQLNTTVIAAPDASVIVEFICTRSAPVFVPQASMVLPRWISQRNGILVIWETTTSGLPQCPVVLQEQTATRRQSGNNEFLKPVYGTRVKQELVPDVRFRTNKS